MPPKPLQKHYVLSSKNKVRLLPAKPWGTTLGNWDGSRETESDQSFMGLGMLMLRCTPALWGEGVCSRSSDIFRLLGDLGTTGAASTLPAIDATR